MVMVTSNLGKYRNTRLDYRDGGNYTLKVDRKRTRRTWDLSADSDVRGACLARHDAQV